LSFIELKDEISVKGVTSAVWDLKTKKIHVEFNSMETNIDADHKAIAKAGHDTEKQKADKKAYEALPECCAYRK
jgi:Cu(I)/Ag(I) efflux system membrane fusion protein